MKELDGHLLQLPATPLSATGPARDWTYDPPGGGTIPPWKPCWATPGVFFGRDPLTRPLCVLSRRRSPCRLRGSGEIPDRADEHVDPAFGTGCVKVTPAHDPNDLRHSAPATAAVHHGDGQGRAPLNAAARAASPGAGSLRGAHGCGSGDGSRGKASWLKGGAHRHSGRFRDRGKVSGWSRLLSTPMVRQGLRRLAGRAAALRPSIARSAPLAGR